MPTSDALPSEAVQSVLDAMPLPILIVDNDLHVLGHNAAAKGLLGAEVDAVRGQRGGRLLNCINVASSAARCGHTPACPRCQLRGALNAAISGERLVRSRASLRLLRRGQLVERHFQVTVSPFPAAGESRWLVIFEDRNDLLDLERLLPICPSCKRSRDDDATRALAEAYLQRHWDSDFTACMCEDCLARLYIQTGTRGEA